MKLWNGYAITNSGVKFDLGTFVAKNNLEHGVAFTRASLLAPNPYEDPMRDAKVWPAVESIKSPMPN